MPYSAPRSVFQVEFELDGVNMVASFASVFAPAAQSELWTADLGPSGTSVPLTTVEGAPGYGNDRGGATFVDGGIYPPPAPVKPAAELTAGFSFVCF